MEVIDFLGYIVTKGDIIIYYTSKDAVITPHLAVVVDFQEGSKWGFRGERKHLKMKVYADHYDRPIIIEVSNRVIYLPPSWWNQKVYDFIQRMEDEFGIKVNGH